MTNSHSPYFFRLVQFWPELTNEKFRWLTAKNFAVENDESEELSPRNIKAKNSTMTTRKKLEI